MSEQNLTNAVGICKWHPLSTVHSIIQQQDEEIDNYCLHIVLYAMYYEYNAERKKCFTTSMAIVEFNLNALVL